jgi:alpha-1,6-mannosyltransferase
VARRRRPLDAGRRHHGQARSRRHPAGRGGVRRDWPVHLVMLGFAASAMIAVTSRIGFPLSGAVAAGSPEPGASNGAYLIGYYAGLVLLIRVWLALLPAAERPSLVPVALVRLAFVLWSLPLILGHPLFSNDVYSYAAQGELASQGIDPWRFGPEVLIDSPFLHSVAPVWRSTPAPYGPLFVILAGWAAELGAHSVSVTLIGMRVLTLAGMVLVAAYLPLLRAAGTGGRPGTGSVLALGLLNPVTLLHLVADAHNEAIMMGLLVAGLAFTLTAPGVPDNRRRYWLGIALIALAAAVKLPAAIALAFAGWQRYRDVPVARRLVEATLALVAGGLVTLVLGVLTGFGWGWVGALGTPGLIRSPVAVATLVELALTAARPLFGGFQPDLLQLARVACLAGVAGIAGVLLLRSTRLGYAKAVGLALLAAALLSPVLHHWYLAWGLIPLAAVAAGRLRRALVWCSVATALATAPGSVHFLLQAQAIGWATLVLGAVLVAAVAVVPLPGTAGPSPLPPAAVTAMLLLGHRCVVALAATPLGRRAAGRFVLGRRLWQVEPAARREDREALKVGW